MALQRVTAPGTPGALIADVAAPLEGSARVPVENPRAGVDYEGMDRAAMVQWLNIDTAQNLGTVLFNTDLATTLDAVLGNGGPADTTGLVFGDQVRIDDGGDLTVHRWTLNTPGPAVAGAGWQDITGTAAVVATFRGTVATPGVLPAPLAVADKVIVTDVDPIAGGQGFYTAQQVTPAVWTRRPVQFDDVVDVTALGTITAQQRGDQAATLSPAQVWYYDGSTWLPIGDGKKRSVPQVGHGFTPYQPIRLNSVTGLYEAADATAEDQIADYIVLDVVDANNFTVAAEDGSFTAPGHGLGTTGQDLYLKDDGTISPGTVGATVQQPVARVESPDLLYLFDLTEFSVPVGQTYENRATTTLCIGAGGTVPLGLMAVATGAGSGGTVVQVDTTNGGVAWPGSQAELEAKIQDETLKMYIIPAGSPEPIEIIPEWVNPVNNGGVPSIRIPGPAVYPDGSKIRLYTETEVVAPVGTPPSGAINSPIDGQIFTATGSPIVIPIEATGTAGTDPVARLEFRSNNTTIGSDTTAPYQFSVSPGAGTHVLTVRIFDTVGRFADSDPVTITVNASAADLSLSSTGVPV